MNGLNDRIGMYSEEMIELFVLELFLHVVVPAVVFCLVLLIMVWTCIGRA